MQRHSVSPWGTAVSPVQHSAKTPSHPSQKRVSSRLGLLQRHVLMWVAAAAVDVDTPGSAAAAVAVVVLAANLPVPSQWSIPFHPLSVYALCGALLGWVAKRMMYW